MESMLLTEGAGRTKVRLSTQWIGQNLIVCLFNDFGHIGAVAVADYCHTEDRASTSVITRLGHKDDSVASRAAYALCKRLKEPVCAIVGIHVDSITGDEIAQISQNCDRLVERFIKSAIEPCEQKENQ
jgi:gallate decarboxylase subunit D